MVSQRFHNDGKSVYSLSPSQKQAKQHIAQKIHSGEYAFFSHPCCVCRGDDYTLLAEKDRYGLPCRVVVCKGCGLIQQNPRMSEEGYHRFYDEDYALLHHGVALTREERFHNEYERGRRIADYVDAHVGFSARGMHVLEIGCGSGGILAYMREQGSIVFGVDVSAEAVEFGKEKHNLPLATGTLQDISLPWDPDVVILAHTLEHFVDPLGGLRYLKKILSANSFVYVEVPGMKNLWNVNGRDFLRSLQQAHVYYFTLTTLLNLMRQAGYEMVCGDEDIRSIWKPSGHTKSAARVENDHEDVIDFLQRLERARRIPTPSVVLFHARILVSRALRNSRFRLKIKKLLLWRDT